MTSSWLDKFTSPFDKNKKIISLTPNPAGTPTKNKPRLTEIK